MDSYIPSSIQKKDNKSTIAATQHNRNLSAAFIDNRPKSIAQRILRDNRANSVQSSTAPIQKKSNNTGLPDNLKSGIENLSGYSMNDVKVHYNSDKPAQLNAHAYAQGTDIHIAAGQEKHLPHEAWHVVQQKQGRVKPTMQMKGKVNVNDDAGLEKEADIMGRTALSQYPTQLKMNVLKSARLLNSSTQQKLNNPAQLVTIGRDYKTSENTNYRTRIIDENYLGVKANAAAPAPAALFTAGNVTSGFRAYTFSGANFVNDCLQFAQRLGLSIAGRAADEILRVKINDAGTNVGFALNRAPAYFGAAPVPNTRDIADKQGFDQGGNTNPAIGETYAIVPQTGAQVQGCAFHISTVVAKDGGDNITCEADASTVRVAPVFDIYTTAPASEFTFHARYKDEYGGDYSATGILAPPSGQRIIADVDFPAPPPPVLAPVPLVQPVNMFAAAANNNAGGAAANNTVVDHDMGVSPPK